MRAVILAVASLAVGGVLNGLRPRPLSWVYQPPDRRLHEAVAALKTPVDSTKESAVAMPGKSFEAIDLEAFQSFASTGAGIVIDARATVFYQQGHVPGALNLPRETFATDYARQKGRLASSRAKEIVVYCSETDCPDAEMVANALALLGFEHMRVYQEGWEEWTRAGLPQEVKTPP